MRSRVTETPFASFGTATSGLRGVLHVGRHALEDEAVAFRARLDVGAREVPARVAIGDRERRGRALGDLAEPGIGRFRARPAERVGGEERGDEGRGEGVRADLLDHRGDRDGLRAGAAAFLRNRERGEAELDDLAPCGAIPLGGLALLVDRVVAGHERPELLHRAVLVEEATRLIAEHLLVVAEAVIPGLCHGSPHFDFGRFRTRSPRMLRWISFVPAAIVMPYEFM